MMAWLKDNAVMKNAWDKLDDEKKSGEKFPIGLFKKIESETYDVAYNHVREISSGQA